MNIALSTLILFFLLVPGIAFRRFYYSEEFSRQYFKESFFGVFIATILPSLFFHVLWYFLARELGFEVNLQVFGDLVSADPSDQSFKNLRANSTNILTYNLSMTITAALSGYFIKKVVRKVHLDRKFKLFRFQNSWHYILKGEFFDFPRADISLDRDKVEDIEFVFVDAILNLNEGTYLYDGILVDYELSNQGGLDTISITNVQRRKLLDDANISVDGEKENNSSKYYPISGHLLILKYPEIVNLNFSYFALDYDEDKEEFSPRPVE